jgi:LmbE family N-acetylglucosaminyl deacetylase
MRGKGRILSREVGVGMKVAVLVAHPDDEVLWPGGTLMMNPDWEVFVGAICRGSDPDRAPKFFRSLKIIEAEGAIADLDDGPMQAPLDPEEVRETLLSLLPEESFDLVFTHGPRGEYTRHRRHEEVCRAALELWGTGRLKTPEVRLFSYEDGGRAYLPRPEPDATTTVSLPDEIWTLKFELIVDIYGFGSDSWEARTIPREEAFRTFADPSEALAFAHSMELSP